MTATAQLGPYTFSRVDYDAANDVLYLGEQGLGEETDPGHVFLYPDEASDQVVGAILVGAGAELDRDGHVAVTLPDGATVDAAELVVAAR